MPLIRILKYAELSIITGHNDHHPISNHQGKYISNLTFYEKPRLRP